MLNIEKENISGKYLLLLIGIAYLFSIAIRMIWVFQFNGYENFQWNNQLMINTNDGYLWASSALNSITGQFENNPRIMSMFHYGVVFFTYITVKILPFSIDTVLLYMPAIISSMVVIPIILIARLYNLTLWGFFSALLGSIAWSYYNRTMIGYYDTDMFSAMAPMIILFFLIKNIEKESLDNALFSALAILIYPFLYDAGLSIVYAIGLIYMAYMVLFHRDDIFTYQSIILVTLALLGIPSLIKLVLIFAIYYFFKTKKVVLKQLIITTIVIVIAFLISGHVIDLIWAKVSSYLFRGTEADGLHFFQVKQTVREAGVIPFSTMANRISGSSIGVISAFIGYILLVINHRPFILALPLIGIGLFSLWGGLRFTVYAVPIAAMSSIYLFYIIGFYVKNKKMKYLFITFLTAMMLYPNITHIIGYKVPTVFNKSEVKILDELKSISTPKDYTLTWWDYGYPIWYYSNTNTLIDGGKHNHDNFIISQILNTDSQIQAANLSRLAVETYVSSDYKIVANEIFHNKKENQLNPNILLDELSLTNYKLPKKTRDIFIYLPNRMLNIFPTVTLFSNLDLITGKRYRNSFFYKSRGFKDKGNSVYLGNNIILNKQTGEIKIGKEKMKVNNFVITQYNKKGELEKNMQVLDRNSPINVIFMKNYNQFLVLDTKMYNSLFIQMFVLEQYDSSLFEPVILNPLAKIYKLKI